MPLCIKAIEKGGLYPTAINGANEQAVSLFLEGKISFLQIAELNALALENAEEKNDDSIEDIFAADKSAREFVLSRV